MLPATYVRIARRKDAEAGLKPWSFSETNPGYVWLAAQAESAVEGDAKRDPSLASTSVSAGSVSSSKTFRTDQRATTRTDTAELAIELYRIGRSSLPSRTRGVFGAHNS